MPCAIAVVTAALYLPRLGEAPRYLVVDELYSALTAHSVATTGRDPHGAFLPLYFQMDLPRQGRPMWFQPVLMYAITLALTLRPLSEAAIRAPMAIAGVVNVVLMYLIGRQVFGGFLFPIAAAALLALTPAHFMYSRYAMDFQAPLPFILGWLLCLTTYLKRPDPKLLLAAGVVLGAGMYSYIAAVALMPLYLVLTCVALWMRRERATRIGLMIVGFAVPLLVAIPTLVRNPTLLFDVAVHYKPDGSPATTDAGASLATIVTPSRIADAAALYAKFWNPRFLFVDGPLRFTEATWLVGVFLLPLAGLLLVGLLRSLRRPVAPLTVVMLAGLLTAPIPASFVGQGEAIRRALELLPFAVLVGVFGLEMFWSSRADLLKTIAFVAFWVVVLALALAGHDLVPRAQAYVRAATVPLGIAGLALALEGFAVDELTLGRMLLPAGMTLFVAQVAYFLGGSVLVTVALAATLAAALLLRRQGASGSGRVLVVTVLLALVASEFTFLYVDFGIGRIGPIPASALLLVVRMAAAGLVTIAACRVAQAARRVADTSTDELVSSLAVIAALCVQVAYFYVDVFTNPVLRFVHVAAIVALAVGVAAWSKRNVSTGRRLGPLTAVCLFGLAALQFGYFYSDYFTSFQARGSGAAVGNVRLALETALDAADGRPVPAMYLARLRNESPGMGNLFAKFYLLKKGRPDLIDRTAEGDAYMGFEADRVAAMPPGSIAIVNPSSRNERTIDQMVAAGDLKRDRLLKTPDGTPMFWLLERTGR